MASVLNNYSNNIIVKRILAMECASDLDSMQEEVSSNGDRFQSINMMSKSNSDKAIFSRGSDTASCKAPSSQKPERQSTGTTVIMNVKAEGAEQDDSQGRGRGSGKIWARGDSMDVEESEGVEMKEYTLMQHNAGLAARGHEYPEEMKEYNPLDFQHDSSLVQV
jgi:hypothetical protein